MWTMRWTLAAATWIAGGLLIASTAASGQSASGPAGATATVGQGAERSSPPATLSYQNRPITELRATVQGRTPQERVRAATRILDDIAYGDMRDRVASERIGTVAGISAGKRYIFLMVPADVDELAGESLDGKAAAVVQRLQTALDEVAELRAPARFAWAVAQAVVGTATFVLLLWLIARGRRVLAARLHRRAAERLERLSAGDTELVRASRIVELVSRAVSIAAAILALLLTYSWLTFTLRRFPYSRPWGESLRGFLFERTSGLGAGIIHAVPGLFSVLLIVVVTRFVVRLSNLLFESIERGRITVPWIFPETAAPTRRLVTALLWLFALIVSYPYLPGSDSDAFKGVSVFVGLVISLGSSGIVNQIMSGFTITYSRALRLGDFVKVGDVEGTVTHVGALSMKLKTPRREEVTIPNSLVVSDTTTNYSRFAETEGVFVPTSVTIGYDVPWRQVHALLSLAAERTAGVRSRPAPAVRQTALQDFYVQYTLLVCLEQADQRGPTLDALHANIQDAFNEHGVQIMSPNYEADPEAPKLVPRDKWYASPAVDVRAHEPDHSGVR